MRRAFFLMFCVLGTGPAWAGSGDPQPLAWIAEYRVHDGQGDRMLVLVRSEARVEYRWAGEPVSVWENGAGGLSHREVFVSEGQVVSYTSGELSAVGSKAEWPQLSHLIDPALRAQLKKQRMTRTSAAHGATAQRYGGDLQGLPVRLDWLDEAELPALYSNGKGRKAYTLELRSLEQRPADESFTATDGMREIDYADIGDMELDPFARRYIREGAGVAAER